MDAVRATQENDRRTRQEKEMSDLKVEERNEDKRQTEISYFLPYRLNSIQ